MKLPQSMFRTITVTWPIGNNPRATLRPRVDAAIKQFAHLAGLVCRWKAPTVLDVVGSGITAGLSGTATIGQTTIALTLRLPIGLWPYEGKIRAGITEALARELPRNAPARSTVPTVPPGKVG